MPTILTDHAARTADGLSLAALRGDTRSKLDSFLVFNLMATGIGRSAFISAAVDYFEQLREKDPAAYADFVERANVIENDLPR